MKPDVDHPANFPGQYTVEASSSARAKPVSATVEIGTGTGDCRHGLSIVGPSDSCAISPATPTPRTTAHVEAVRYDSGFGRRPKLLLRLHNTGSKSAVFTVTAENYATDRPQTYRVPPQGTAVHSVNPARHWIR